MRENAGQYNEEEEMTTISEVILSGIRCFAEPQRISLRKVTLFVGDNSTGKTTALGCLAAFSGLVHLHDLPNPFEATGVFDRPPYQMGGFATIARRGESNFIVSGTLNRFPWRSVRIVFDDRGGLVQEREFAIEYCLSDGRTRRLAISRKNGGSDWFVALDGETFSFPQQHLTGTTIATWLSHSLRKGIMPYGGNPDQYRRFSRSTTDHDVTAFVRVVNALMVFPMPSHPSPYRSVGPQPVSQQRVFDEWPLVLRDSADLRRLEKLGSGLGLFQGIHVDTHDNGTFALRARQGGMTHHMADVGYGVRALAPVLQELVELERKGGGTLLLQQPETRVHPSAQAGLAQVMAESSSCFVIETHSDHFIDRFRIAVKRGQLSEDDLSIVFFESDGHGAVAVHNITVNKNADYVGDPKSYRRFFRRESSRLLGF